MPRKPLVIFIEGLFRVAMKITKGFQNMGTDVKLLFKQLVSYSALRAISSISPPPISCAENKICQLIVHVLAVNAFHFVSIRSGRFRTSTEPTLHFAYIASIHLITPRLREILISISQAHSFVFPNPFSNAFPAVHIYFCDELAPKNNILNFPHRPLVVAVISGNRVLLLVLAVGAFIPAPLRSGNYVRTSLRTPTLHYASIRASTSAPRGISIPFFTP
jgi:hypothetical protein